MITPLRVRAPAAVAPPVPAGTAFWAVPADALLQRLDTSGDGLSSAEAARRLAV